MFDLSHLQEVTSDERGQPLFLCPRSNLAETAMEGSTGGGGAGWFATDDVVAYETVPHPDLGQWAESLR